MVFNYLYQVKFFLALKDEENKLIRENFFIIDSDNLEQVNSHMYGYTITKDGILTDNYYRELGEYKKPEPQGVYIMIRKMENEIFMKIKSQNILL